MNSFAVDQAIRQAMPYSAIVDIAGVHNPRTGGFHVVQTAIDAGHKSIFVRTGSYPGFAFDDKQDISIVGESWDAIIDGAKTSNAITLGSVKRLSIRNIQIKTTCGGGNEYMGMAASGACEDIHFLNCWFSESDSMHIDASSDVVRMMVINCLCENSDGHAFNPPGEIGGTEGTIFLGNVIQDNGASGFALTNSQNDDLIIVANMIHDNGGWGVDIGVNDNDNVVVANRISGNSSGQIQDASGSSTVASNDLA